jgi:type I restriction enzyme, S subunit
MPDTLIGRVPEEWMETTLAVLCSSGGGDIQTGPFGSQLHASDYVPSGIPSVMPQNIGDNVILEGGIARITPEDAARLSRYLLVPGDIVYSRRGDVERRAWVRPQQAGWLCGTGCLRVRLGSSADSRFMSYYLGHQEVRAWIVRHAIGATMPNLNTGILGAVPVVIPPMRDQAAIAEVLGALDDKVAVNDRIFSSVQALGDACFMMAQTSAARRSTLAELATEKTPIFGDGYRTKRSEHGQPGLPILRVAEVMDGRIEPEFADFVADSYRSAMGGKVSQAGDVILTSKGTVGRVAVITAKDPSFVYSPQLCYFRILAGSPLPSSYMYFWLRSSDFWQQAETRKSQTDMADYLSLTDIRKLTIPMPAPGSNQQWSPTLSGLLTQISACNEENRALVELRDTLLPKLMSGEIRVRDAEKIVEDVT